MIKRYRMIIEHIYYDFLPSKLALEEIETVRCHRHHHAIAILSSLKENLLNRSIIFLDASSILMSV